MGGSIVIFPIESRHEVFHVCPIIGKNPIKISTEDVTEFIPVISHLFLGFLIFFPFGWDGLCSPFSFFQDGLEKRVDCGLSHFFSFLGLGLLLDSFFSFFQDGLEKRGDFAVGHFGVMKS